MQGNQKRTEEEEEKKAPIPVDWEAIRLDKSNKFNDALDKCIDEELHKIDETWHPGMECPYKRLLKATEEAAREVAPSDGKKKQPPWFQMSEEAIMRAVGARDKAHSTYQVSPTQGSRQTLCLRRRKLTATKATARVKWLEELKLGESEAINDDPRSTWQSIKEINTGFSGHHEKAVIIKMRKNDGTFAKTEAENAKVLFDHFHWVMNCKE
jgi:hypothetical protein